MARFTCSRHWRPWAGSLDLLTETATLARSELRSRHQGDAPVRVTIEQGGLSAEFDSLDDFAEGIDERDLGQIERIGIEVGRYHSGEGVRLGGGERGVGLGVASGDRTFMEGLCNRLTEKLSPRSALQPPLILRQLMRTDPAFIGFLVGFGLFYAVAAALTQGTDIEPRGLRIGLAAACGLAVWGSFYVFGIAALDFELLREDEAPRYQRWRKRLFTVLGALLVGIVGSIIAAAIYSGD